MTAPRHTRQAQGGAWTAVQTRPHTAEKSWAPKRRTLHHRQPPHPGRPVSAAGSLYRPARESNGAQGESRHDCTSGVRAFSGDPLNWQQQAIALGDETRVAWDRLVRFSLSSSTSPSYYTTHRQGLIRRQLPCCLVVFLLGAQAQEATHSTRAHSDTLSIEKIA